MNQPKEQIQVPEAAKEALYVALDERGWADATGEARKDLGEALASALPAIEERLLQRLLSDEAVDAVTGYMEWPRDGFVGDATAWRKAHARAALERLAAALSQPHNTEEENDEG